MDPLHVLCDWAKFGDEDNSYASLILALVMQGFKEEAEALVNTCTVVSDDPGVVGPQGFAPLHFATCGTHYEDGAIIGILLEARADVKPSLPCSSGRRPCTGPWAMA